MAGATLSRTLERAGAWGSLTLLHSQQMSSKG